MRELESTTPSGKIIELADRLKASALSPIERADIAYEIRVQAAKLARGTRPANEIMADWMVATDQQLESIRNRLDRIEPDQ